MGKLIDRNGRLFGKVSIIDIVVVLMVLVMALAFYVKNDKLDAGNINVVETPITFTVAVENVAKNVGDALEVGDLVYDKDRSANGAIGKIVAIEKLPCEVTTQLFNGTYAMVTNEYAYNLRVTVEGKGSVEDGSYLINNIYGLGLNSSRNFYTPYTVFTGNVIEIG